MTARLYPDRRASVALEFALVAPAMLGLFMGSVALCAAIWTLTALQSTAEQAARCWAIKSTACATAASGSGTSSAAVSYAEQVAATLGVASLIASEVTLSTPTLAGAPFNAVVIAHSFNLFGFHLTLRATGLFPTNGGNWGTMPPSS